MAENIVLKTPLFKLNNLRTIRPLTHKIIKKSPILIILMFYVLCISTPAFGINILAHLIGSKAKPWQVTDWFNSQQLELEELNKQVILIRWWTAPFCPYCVNSADALNEFYEQYHDKGLEVLGFYHHKSPEAIDKNKIMQHAKELGFEFPIAIDYEWKTLKDWWLIDDKNRFSSVTFLLDRKGLIRHIHPGGEYVKGDSDYLEMKEMIELLLAEK